MPSRKHKPSSPLLARLFAFTITFGILFSLQSNAGATGNDTPIRIAILPCTDIVKTYTQAQPLRVYLQKILHRQIEIL
ncbi:MAG: hypothetical protein OEL66_07380, partial [Desulfobulbaceae bacterium]|nr:hypothetical protein [Desulfobulbaceae bacterium]